MVFLLHRRVTAVELYGFRRRDERFPHLPHPNLLPGGEGIKPEGEGRKKGNAMNDEEPKYKDYDDDLIGTIWALSIFFGLCLIIMFGVIVWRML